MQLLFETNDISRQLTSIETMAATKTNVIMLDTTTLLSLLIITVFIVQVFSLTIQTNNIQTLIGKRSFKSSIHYLPDTSLLRRPKRMWEQEYIWSNKFSKRNSMPLDVNTNYAGYESSTYGYQR